MSDDVRVVLATCPECQTMIPMVTVTFITTGHWRKRVRMELDGDATDYVAHVWAHAYGVIDPS